MIGVDTIETRALTVAGPIKIKLTLTGFPSV